VISIRKILSHDCGPFWQFVKYGAIGVMATLVQTGVFYILASTCFPCLTADDVAVKLLGLMDYGRLYVREVEDSFTGETRHSYGFCTTSLTRPVILSELIRVLRDHTELVCHRETLEEMLSFVRNSQLRPEAAPGTHDDCVMALAIAHYIRPQQSMHRELNRQSASDRWTEDMWQDYRSSDPEGRAYLMEKWGAV